MRLLTTTQAAKQVGCTVRTIQRAIESGVLKAHGERFKLIDADDLAKFKLRPPHRPPKKK